MIREVNREEIPQCVELIKKSFQKTGKRQGTVLCLCDIAVMART